VRLAWLALNESCSIEHGVEPRLRHFSCAGRVPLRDLYSSFLGMKSGLLPLQVFDDRTKSINEILIGNGLHKTPIALNLLSISLHFSHMAASAIARVELPR